MNLKDKLKVSDLLAEPNIATLLSEHDLEQIGMQCVKDFDNDLMSRSSWEARTEASLKLALQVAEAKNFPWLNASNIKFPLLTIAALQYHARSYPVLINGDTPVRCRVFGDDFDGVKGARAKRVENHMSFQVMEEDEEWESEMDKVLITQPIIGCAFKKTYFDPVRRHNVSENVLAKDLVVNYWTKSLDTADRITHVLQMSKNEIYERVIRGLWIDVSEPRPQQSASIIQNNNLQNAQDNAQGLTPPEPNDSSTPIEILEHHCHIDFDDDGYAEPYIVYIRRDNKKVARIVARYMRDGIERNEKDEITRIKAEHYFTKYPFVPSPDGGFYDLGFGVLLGPLNESINTIVNQLVDAGTIANTAGGFLSRGVKLRGGSSPFTPMEWKHVDSTGDDLRKGIVPLPVREPSQVLFSLLGMLINYGERIGGSVDILTGQNPGQNTPAETSRTMAEQGMKIFSGIFKRTYRSLKDEFKKLYRLNQLYLEDSKEYGANEGFILMEDYQGPSNDIRPSADPSIVSDTQRMAQAQAVLQLATTTPGINVYEAQKTYLKALRVPNIEQILPDPKGPNAIKPAPNPKVQIEQMKLQDKMEDRKISIPETMERLRQSAELNQAKIMKLEADAIHAIASAGGVQTGQEIAFLNSQIAAEKQYRGHLADVMKIMKDVDQNEYQRNLPNKENA
jgi:chaperonin GroES